MCSFKSYTINHPSRLFFLSIIFFLLCTYSFAQNTPQTNLPRAIVSTQEHTIDVQLAQSPQEWNKGLMWRASMPENEGMLFVFNKPSRQCFWMKNTYLPLSAAFVDDNGIIVNIADMQPLSTREHCSDKPVRFVLEVHQGWFKKRNIKAGDHISGLDGFVH